jgi:hypothetical protein
MTGDQMPLFDSPASPIRRRYPAPRSSSVSYNRFRPRQRVLCDDCCRQVLAIGQALADHPRVAIWRRVDDTSAVVLCQIHKDARHDDDTR